MKKILLLFFVFIPMLVSAQKPEKKTTQKILKLLTSQQKCWNNADLEGYMSGYWNSDSLKFITKTSVTFGWRQTLDRYKAHYPNKEAMGTLAFEEVELLKLNSKNIFVIGKWTLYKISETVSGRFTLVCRKMGKEWKIIIDHSS